MYLSPGNLFLKKGTNTEFTLDELKLVCCSYSYQLILIGR